MSIYRKSLNLQSVIRLLTFLIVIFIPGFAFSLTPVARWDVVPYQRLEKGEIFNIGVVAFSKEGIGRVEFTVTGQGYNGANPQNSYEMTLNTRTNVYEYWVPLRGDDFTTNGVFSIRAIVYGTDGGSRTLGTLSLVVNATGALSRKEAWVSTSGSNTTGKVDNRSLPFATVGGAVSAIQAVNGGASDGSIIYLFEGTYTLGTGTVKTSNEWITLKKDNSASIENTIVIGGGTVVSTNFMKFSELTIQSSSAGNLYLFKTPAVMWVDKCRVIGSGRHFALSNPTYRSGSTADDYPSYFTDTYMYNVDFGVTRATLCRNINIKSTGNDPFVNALCIINARVDDVDPGTTYWHADAYQSWGPGPDNRIIYGYYGTNLHYQGLFLRQEPGTPGINNAFVNMFLEMREPGRLGSSGATKPILMNAAIFGEWNHLIIWNCTFPSTNFSFYDEAATNFKLTNSSIVGNMFYSFEDSSKLTIIGVNPDYTLPGNTENNDFLYNHYMWSAVVQGGAGPSEPHWHSKSPDSSVEKTFSIGDPLLSYIISADYEGFGVPLSNSPLVNRMPFSLVPVDALGNQRDQTPDIGALESLVPNSNSPVPNPPTGIRIF